MKVWRKFLSLSPRGICWCVIRNRNGSRRKMKLARLKICWIEFILDLLCCVPSQIQLNLLTRKNGFLSERERVFMLHDGNNKCRSTS